MVVGVVAARLKLVVVVVGVVDVVACGSKLVVGRSPLVVVELVVDGSTLVVVVVGVVGFALDMDGC